MYSWIASFFTTDDNEDESLYAKSQEENEKAEGEWTWIEVIENDSDQSFILIQSSEEQRCQFASCQEKPHIKKRRTRRERMAEKTFIKCLHLDHALSKKKTKPILKPLSLKALCRRKLSTSEVLSSTCHSPTEDFWPQNNEFDLETILRTALLMKQLVGIAIMLEKNQLDEGLQLWLEDFQYRCNQQSIEWKQKPAIMWKPSSVSTCASKPSSEYNGWKDGNNSGNDILFISEVTYHMPGWMSKIDVFDEDEVQMTNKIDFPNWIRKIDVFEEAERKTRSEVVKRHKFPSWMTQIDMFDTEQGEELKTVPSWNQHYVSREDICRLEVRGKKLAPEVMNACQWMEFLDIQSETEATEVCLRSRGDVDCHPGVNWCNPQPVLKKIQSVCESMMNAAVLIATYDACSPTIVPAVYQKRKWFFKNFGNIRKKMKATVKKNKKWLRRQNEVTKLSTRRRKHAPKNFSGRQGMRAF
ncbi:uncharacterized protein LOC130622404 [Hydractinia symbiolongicarpus]|uniref:uncharacterized protein LOC130622404 n=1 Tax=Hydractinia symbiolongicarpus TaxID=13093 RepID=UPI00254FDC85|nr:uncharacterized protein LOC130622404 [Hydractinia symbiolongicarpus]